MSELNWKKHLLASGAPLEFEVGRILSKNGFLVSADYEYLRQDGSSEKEFSVDLSGIFFGEGRSKVNYSVEMLVECKYRSREKNLIFLSDSDPEFRSGILGYTLTYIDELSPFHLNAEAVRDFENEMPFVYKGIELHDRGSQEKDLKHAVQQLRYASPFLLSQAIESILGDHGDDRHPKFLCRVLVTNAPLLIMEGSNIIARIEAASNVEDVAQKVDALIFSSGHGPDFSRHCKRVLSELSLDKWRSRINSISYDNRTAGKRSMYYRDSPTEFVRKVTEYDWIVHKHTSQIFVVTLPYLQNFLLDLKSACRTSYRLRRKSEHTKRGRRLAS